MGVAIEGGGSDGDRFTGCTPSPGRSPDPGEQFSQRIGLGDVVVGSEFECCHHLGFGVLGAHDDDWHIRFLAYRTQHIEPAHSREHEIEEHDIGPGLPKAVQTDPSVVGGVDDEPLPFEGDANRLDERCLIFDDEDPGQRLLHNGRITVNVDPSPSVLVTVTSPR